jgi:hypothetical protein
MYVATVLSGCYKSRSRCCICIHVASICFKHSRCFLCMLPMFYLDVAYVLQWLHTCFPGVSDVCCKCSNYFREMLQVFHLDVAKVDMVLHMLQWDPLATVVCYSYWACVHARGNGGGASGRRGKRSGRRFRCGHPREHMQGLGFRVSGSKCRRARRRNSMHTRVRSVGIRTSGH